MNGESASGDNEQTLPTNVHAAGPSRLKSSQLAFAIALLLLILLAFVLRIVALERQSMWSDEGLSYYRATLSTPDVLKGLIVIDGAETQDTNPPLYFLLLHWWENLGGDSIFALRYSGVLAGTLAVPLIFVLGTLIYGRWAGLTAALLMAISPFHIWQSQVLRNYSLLLTLNLASVYGLFRYTLAAPGQHKSRWLALWFLAGLLGIYTHYFGFFVFAYGIFTLAVLLVWRWNISRMVRQKRFWIALLLGLLILVPAIAFGLDRFRAGQQFDFNHIALAQVLVHALSAFGVGIAPTLQHTWWRYVPALFLAVAGLLIGFRQRRLPTLVLLGYQLIPLGLMLLLSTINPLYNGVRHLLIGLPPFLLFAANGAASIDTKDFATTKSKKWRLLIQGLRLLLFAVVIVIQVEWLYRQFNDPKLLRDDVRGAAEYLNQVAEADDLIILHDTIIGFTFDYYYDGAAEWRSIPALYEQDVAAAQMALEEAGRGADRIWFLARPTPRTGFPRKELWDWAELNWPRFFNQEFPSMWLRVQLVGYRPQPAIDGLPLEATPIDELFGEALQLHGVEMPAVAAAGKPWWGTLYWSNLDADAGDYTLSLRFVDPEGQVWGQDDGLLWHEYPPGQWPANTVVTTDLAIELASGVPPGDYEVWLRVMDGERRPFAVDGERVDVLLGHIQLSAAQEIAALPPISEQFVRGREVDYLGYMLPQDEIKPGHVIPIDLFWRVRQTPAEDYGLRIELVDQAGEVIASEEGAPTRADYPATQWQVGELLQSKILLNVPASADETPHAIRVNLIAPSSGKPIVTVTLADHLLVDPWPFVSELPLDMEPLDTKFGDPANISLQGFELASPTLSPGDQLDLTLFWQAHSDISDSYYVFVHLMAQDDSIAAQVDRAPVQGFRPTVSWREGEVIEDHYTLPLGVEIPPGSYQLWVGLYNPDTWERPLTAVNGQQVPDKRVHLGEITVGQRE